jgi:hypothetical protein
MIIDGFAWVDRSIVESVPDTRGTYDVIVNAWWMVNEAGQVAFYLGRGREASKWRWRAPQCNQSRFLVERLLRPGATGVVLIPVAFVPHRCES